MIISGIAISYLLTTKESRLHILFPNADLMKRDEELFLDYWRLSGTLERIKYHHTLNFECGVTDLLLVDESDHFIYNHPFEFR